MKKFLLIVVSAVLLLGPGCSVLAPKNVEFGQDKVQKFPVPDEKFREVQRQAAAKLSEQLDAIEENLLAEGRSPDEVRPVGEAASLADALSTSLGPPLKPFKLKSVEAWRGSELLALSDKLERETAYYVRDVRDFSEDNDKNAGKKIEGTGWLQIGYFSFVGVLLIIGFLGFIALKVVAALTATAFPEVGLGLQVAKVPVKLASKALSQVLGGGEAFKSAIKSAGNAAQFSADEVLKLFREHQETKQDSDAQELVKQLTKK